MAHRKRIQIVHLETVFFDISVILTVIKSAYFMWFTWWQRWVSACASTATKYNTSLFTPPIANHRPQKHRFNSTIWTIMNLQSPIFWARIFVCLCFAFRMRILIWMQRHCKSHEPQKCGYMFNRRHHIHVVGCRLVCMSGILTRNSHEVEAIPWAMHLNELPSPSGTGKIVHLTFVQCIK